MRQPRSHDAGHDSAHGSAQGSAHGPAPGKRTRSEQLAPVQQREREGGAAGAVFHAAPAAADYLLYPEPPAANDEHRPPVSFVDSLLAESAPGAGMAAGAVQRAATANRSEAGPGDVHAAAAAGIAGPGGALPFADVIQRSFGAHDISAIQAHVGGPAAAASAAMGAEAYATGQHVAFARPPDLHTAAHEAAHVVQQRAGVQLKGGVGEAGDAYEQQADAVADAVVRGDSAEHLLATGVTGAPALGAGSIRSAIQNKSAPGGDVGPEPPAGLQPTGIPMVDAGFTCERGEGADCFLAPAERLQVQIELAARLGEDHASFKSAAGAARVDLLLEKDSGWGFVAEMLFNAASLTMIGGIVRGLTALRSAATVKDALELMGRTTSGSAMRSIKELVASINVDAIEGLLGQVSRGARVKVKASMASLPPDRAARMMFLEQLKKGHELFVRELRMQAPASLDDAQLLALVLSLNNGEAEYRAQIDDLLARHKAHALHDLGENSLGRRQLVRFRAYGRERVAIAQMNHQKEIFKHRGESYRADGRLIFERWVDADLHEAAAEMNDLRNGDVPVVEAGHRLGMLGNTYVHGFTDRHGNPPRELNRWIDEAGGVDGDVGE